MERARAPEEAPLGAGTTVVVVPALGGPWLGVTVDVSELAEDVAGAIEITHGYVLVRCSDPLYAPALVPGQIYLVLARFVGSQV